MTARKRSASFRDRIYNLAFVMAVLGYASSAIAQIPGTFTSVGNMTTARSGNTATLLSNGKVLFAGGYSGSGYLASAELYDPSTGVFTPTGDMMTARSRHSATLLPDGRVLITGGNAAGVTVASTELYDPSTGIFTATGGTTTVSGIATLLKNGKVLITGTAAQLYDPATQSFAPTGSYIGPFYNGPFAPGQFFYPDTATLLQDGRVLIVGNADNSGAYLEHEELYDPVAGTFRVTGKMHTFGFGSDSIWSGHTATLLPSGKVLLAGGESEDFGTFSIAELYDPTMDTFTQIGNMTMPRVGHTATLLPDGTVLVAGGDSGDGGGASISAELYDPATATFAPAGSMITGREQHTATRLPDGTVLLAAGYTGSVPGENGGASLSSSAELYTSCSAACLSDTWQQAIAAMKTAAGTDSLNFYQWAWYWQTLPAFSGAPAGFGVAGSISPDRMTLITTAGGGNPFAKVSAEQWVLSYSSSTAVTRVVNAASHLPGAIAAGELVLVTGSGLGPPQVVSATPDSDGIYPAQLAGTMVLVNDTPVPLFYTSTTEVAAVLPDSLAGGIAQVTVTYQGHTSASITVPVAPAAPGLFTVDGTGQGHAASVNQNGLVNTAVHWEGDVVTLFATGLGQAAAGVTIHGFHLPVNPISVGKGTIPGTTQIKVPILFGQDCDTPVVIQVGNASSQPGVTIAVDLCI